TTTSSVNMREKPDKNANIVTVIAQDVKLEFVSEDNGWTQVIFQGQTGYVSSDYVKSDMADSTTDSGTSGAADSGAASQGTADGSTTGAADNAAQSQ
ncbi:MAG TPA: SH3 domain-containing protein, partial [Agathobacter rectalis]|nr:SH3 domain-containing protein [Agathobacter rectalis]